MQTHVNLHAAGGGEALETTLALEGLDARVRLHVGGESTLHSEGPEALLALEGLFVGVDADVTHQVARLLELLGAVWAAVPAHTILLPDGT